MVRALFPATFDPIHFGHINIATRASRLFDEIVVGVYDRPLKSLLFSPEERIEMTRIAFKDVPNIVVTGYSGLTIEFCRKINAQVIVRGLRVFSDFEYELRMALANNRLAPDIEIVALITNESHSFLSSTTVREIGALDGDVSSMVPAHVEKALKLRYGELLRDNNLPDLSSLRD